jgi:hypothetical protein
MVEEKSAGALARAGRARDRHHRRTLGIGAGDRVDEIEGAGPIGDDGDPEAAVEARRRVGGEADRGLVAERVMGKDAAVLDDLEERQHEIAGYPEDLAGAVVLEALQQYAGERGHGATLPIHAANANAPAASP